MKKKIIFSFLAFTTLFSSISFDTGDNPVKGSKGNTGGGGITVSMK